MGSATLEGHQIGSPLLTISCAACEPSGTLSPEESNTTTFVPLGTCESELDDDPLFEVRPPLDDGAAGSVLLLSARAGTVKMALKANTINVLIERIDNNLFFSIFLSLCTGDLLIQFTYKN